MALGKRGVGSQATMASAVHNPFGSPAQGLVARKRGVGPGGESCRVKLPSSPTKKQPPKPESSPERYRAENRPAPERSPTSVKQKIETTTMPRHTFQVTSQDVDKGDHAVAILWIMREIPEATKLELKFFTASNISDQMSIECAWEREDEVMRSVDMELSHTQVVPVGVMLLSLIAESAKNVCHMSIYTGLERINEFTLGKVLDAFSVAGHWAKSLQDLEINWSCIESGTFSHLSTLPTNLRSIKLDGCQMLEEGELNFFVADLPKLEGLRVVGSETDDKSNISMIHI